MSKTNWFLIKGSQYLIHYATSVTFSINWYRMARVENSFVWTVLPNVKKSNCRKPFYRSMRSDLTNIWQSRGIEQPSLSKTGYKAQRGPLVNTLDDHKNRNWDRALETYKRHTRQLQSPFVDSWYCAFCLRLLGTPRTSCTLAHAVEVKFKLGTVEGVPRDICKDATMPQERYKKT